MAIPFGEPGSATTESTIDQIYDGYGVPKTASMQLQRMGEDENDGKLQDFVAWEAERLAAAERNKKMMADLHMGYDEARKKEWEARKRARARGMATYDYEETPEQLQLGLLAWDAADRARLNKRHERIASKEGPAFLDNAHGAPRTIMMDIEVKLRLLPAVHLLTKAHQTAQDRNEASRIASETRTYVAKAKGSTYLESRCNYYVAIAHNDDPKLSSNAQARRYHELAREATLGKYPEGQSAGQWLDHWERLNETQSPTSRIASWAYTAAAGVFNYVRGSPTSPDKQRRSETEDDSFGRERSSIADGSSIARGGERIPSFTTWNSSDVGSPEARSPQSGSFTVTSQEKKDFWSRKGDKRVSLQRPSQHTFAKTTSPTSATNHSDLQRKIAHDALDGHVDSPRPDAKTKATRGRDWEARRRSYMPEGVSPPRKAFQVQSMFSPGEGGSPLSPLSPGSGFGASSRASVKRPSYFSQTQRPSYTGADPPAPAQESSPPYNYSVGEDRAAITVGAGSDSPKKRRMGSLSVIATGLDLAGVLPHRRRSEMAAPEQKLEEGESPFSPKQGERGYYGREEGIQEEEV